MSFFHGTDLKKHSYHKCSDYMHINESSFKYFQYLNYTKETQFGLKITTFTHTLRLQSIYIYIFCNKIIKQVSILLAFHNLIYRLFSFLVNFTKAVLTWLNLVDIRMTTFYDNRSSNCPRWRQTPVFAAGEQNDRQKASQDEMIQKCSPGNKMRALFCFSVLLLQVFKCQAKTVSGTLSSKVSRSDWGQYVTTFCFHGKQKQLQIAERERETDRQTESNLLSISKIKY